MSLSRFKKGKNEIVTSAMSPYMPLTDTCNVDFICLTFLFKLKVTMLCFAFMLSGRFHVIPDLHLDSTSVTVECKILLIFLNNVSLLYYNS